MTTGEIYCCMFCGSTDGAYNCICNYHYMIFQDRDELNNYLDKFDELQQAKQKLLGLVK